MNLKQDILKLRGDGKTYNEICKLLGCSKSIISYYCKSYSIDRKIINKEDVISFFKIEKDVNKTIEKFDISRRRLSEIIGKYKLLGCYKCGSEVETSIFTPKVFCSVKCRHESRTEYLKNKGYNYANVKSWRIIKKKKCVDYKGGECVVCGYNTCLSALEFHHLDPLKKDFSIGEYINRSFDKVKIELDKCILVCANCHREIHENQHLK